MNDEEREMAIDLQLRFTESDRRAPLADFECGHGRLAGDSSVVCGCWPDEEPTE